MEQRQGPARPTRSTLANGVNLTHDLPGDHRVRITNQLDIMHGTMAAKPIVKKVIWARFMNGSNWCDSFIGMSGAGALKTNSRVEHVTPVNPI